jgi:hypothetical protein
MVSETRASQRPQLSRNIDDTRSALRTWNAFPSTPTELKMRTGLIDKPSCRFWAFVLVSHPPRPWQKLILVGEKYLRGTSVLSCFWHPKDNNRGTFRGFVKRRPDVEADSAAAGQDRNDPMASAGVYNRHTFMRVGARLGCPTHHGGSCRQALSEYLDHVWTASGL